MRCDNCKFLKLHTVNFNDETITIECGCPAKNVFKINFGENFECRFYEDNARTKFIKTMLKQGYVEL